MKKFIFLYFLLSCLLCIFFITDICCYQLELENEQNLDKNKIIERSLHLKKFLDTFNGTVNVERITPMGLLYEVVVVFPEEKKILYLTKDLKYLILGTVYDQEVVNVTQKRYLEVNKLDFQRLPLELALVQKEGNGTKKLAVFLDPMCPYCKAFVDHMRFMDKKDYTLYIFLYPLSSESRKLAEKIACSNLPPFEAYLKVKEITDSCEKGKNLVDLHFLVAQSYKVKKVPFIILEDGTNFYGFIPSYLNDFLKSKDYSKSKN